MNTKIGLISIIRSGRVFALALLSFFILVSGGFGQTNWSVEGSGPSYGEYNAPDPLCVPGLLPYATFPAPPPPPGCVANSFFPSSACEIGGSAFDNDGNTFSGGPAFPAMIHSDGVMVEMTDAATGAFILSMPVGGVVFPGLVSGVGYDSALDIIWVTDGTFCAGLGLAICPVLPPIVVPAFPLPVAPPTLASGLAWDPCTGTLWFCDCFGKVVNCTTAGVPIGSFPATPPLGALLFGVTVNTTNGNIQVTDGALVAEFTPAGILAATGAFYLFSNPFAIPLWATPVSGISFTLRPQPYGRGCSTTGPPPSIGFSGGYSWAGNAGFTIFETGATPGATAYIVYGLSPACPPVPIGGCPTPVGGGGLWIFPFFTPISLGAVPASGTVTLPAPLPAPAPPPCGFPVGISVYVQFVNVISFVPLVTELSDAMVFTVGAL